MQEREEDACPILDREMQLGTVSKEREPEYLTTPEAARYLRKSVSWLLRQPGIAYIPGRPNVYKKSDLDQWFDRNKFRPAVV